MFLLNDICRWWLDSAVASGLLLLAVALAVRLTPQPAQRVRMIQCGLAASLLIALANVLPGVPRLSLMMVEPHPQAMLTDGFFEEAVAEATAARPAPSATPSQSPTLSPVSPLHPLSLLAHSRLHWRTYVAGAVISLASLSALRLLRAFFTLHRWRKSSLSADAATRALLNEMPSAHRIALRFSTHINRPCALGMLHPAIFLPLSLRDASPATLATLLRHELAHIQNRDAWTALLMAITRIILCPSPILCWLDRELRLAQEILADAAATHRRDRAAYAQALLSLARSHPGRVPLLATAAWSSRTDLLRRMRILLTDTLAVAPRCGRRFTLLALTLAFLTSSLLAAVSLSGTKPRTQLLASERRGILFLMQTQEPNGGWLTRFGPAPTALAVRAILNAGIDLQHPVIQHALAYVESTRQPDGGFYIVHEPTYHTAIVLSMYAALDTPQARQRLVAGRQFLQLAASPASKPGTWYRSEKSELTSSSRSLAFADPTERASDAVLDTYGSITYAKWKSLVYAGLSSEDPRVKQGKWWIERNWSLEKHPGTGNADGLYYYYLALARTLKASGASSLATPAGPIDWRNSLQHRLRTTQSADGSWHNEKSGRWLEDQPELVTAYALLTLQSTR